MIVSHSVRIDTPGVSTAPFVVPSAVRNAVIEMSTPGEVQFGGSVCARAGMAANSSPPTTTATCVRKLALQRAIILHPNDVWGPVLVLRVMYPQRGASAIVFHSLGGPKRASKAQRKLAGRRAVSSCHGRGSEWA